MELRFLPTSLSVGVTGTGSMQQQPSQQQQQAQQHSPQQELQNGHHNHHQHSHQQLNNNNCESSPGAGDQQNRRTLDRSIRNLNHIQQQQAPLQSLHHSQQNHQLSQPALAAFNDIGLPPQTELAATRIPSLRRTPRRTAVGGNGTVVHVPSSPRFKRAAANNDKLQVNRSPLPQRVAAAAAASKRNRLGSQSNSGSLNSIEV